MGFSNNALAFFASNVAIKALYIKPCFKYTQSMQNPLNMQVKSEFSKIL